jgi:hypothetical protein
MELERIQNEALSGMEGSSSGQMRYWEVQGPEHSRFFRVSSAAKEEPPRLAGKSGSALSDFQ